jgi:ribosome biogenesis GTP-binding protein YsxC/EngB
MRIERVTLRATVADHGKGPKDPLPQVAFAGRSNVGKSSLLNSLFGTRLAAVSKTPGKTRTLNYYLVDDCCYFVDLPGYGYARTGREQRQAWGKNVTTYLLEEDRLRLVVGLVDPRIPTSPLDVDLVEFVRRAGKRLRGRGRRSTRRSGSCAGDRAEPDSTRVIDLVAPDRQGPARPDRVAAPRPARR